MLTYNYSNPLPPLRSEEEDQLFKDAVEYILKTGKASATLFQRHFKIGFARSGMLLDELEQAGVVGPVNGVKPREILIKNFTDVKLPVTEKVTSGPPPKPLKWHSTTKAPKNLGLDIGFNLEKYGNLFVVGSQFTAVGDYIDFVIAEFLRDFSPEDLKLIIIDGFITQITVPENVPHLLTSKITRADQAVAAFKWVHKEIYERLNGDRGSTPKILVVLNGFNEISPNYSDFDDIFAWIISHGREAGVFVIATFDYLRSDLGKNILAGNGARLVFRPVSRQMARTSGVPESIKLESPNDAILDVIFEPRRKVTVKPANPQKIYKQIFK